MNIGFPRFYVQFLALADEPFNLIIGQISEYRHLMQFRFFNHVYTLLKY